MSISESLSALILMMYDSTCLDVSKSAAWPVLVRLTSVR
jgi:hypothetical protein